MVLVTAHKVDTWVILRVSNPLSAFQSVGQFVVLSHIFELFRRGVLMEGTWSVQVSVVDFDYSLGRFEERSIEPFVAFSLTINYNGQLYVDVPLPRADQFWCRIVERRRLSVGSELAFSGVKQVY